MALAFAILGSGLTKFINGPQHGAALGNQIGMKRTIFAIITSCTLF
jgi:hypothetical protein